MKMMKFVMTAVLLAAVALCLAGCAQAADPEVSSAVPVSSVVSVSSAASEPAAVTGFKSGTWVGDGVKYIFGEDGKSGRTMDAADGTGVGFEYELATDGSCVFHMGSIDDITKATVAFSDGGNTAKITWEDGTGIILEFSGTDTPAQ